nr:GNAT family protein [uncultured Fusobacterium sp.]
MIKNDIIELIPANENLAEQVLDYYLRNKNFLESFEPKREDIFFTLEFQKELLKKEAKAWDDKKSYRFYIRDLSDTNKIIGLIGINEIVYGAFLSCFLGYKLDKDYINKGIMTSATNLIIDFAFNNLKLHRIEGNVMPKNKASLRVLEKCGFINEGISKYYLNINGIWEDHIHMVKINYNLH